ncbi:MAG: DUF5320 domain-containing protein [Candidatus Bathyarchaeia archaeon]
MGCITKIGGIGKCEEDGSGLKDGGVRHPWPPPWTRTQYYSTSPAEELKALQDYKRELEAELAELTKRIEELKKLTEGKIKKKGAYSPVSPIT